jgi:uncharacterized protein
MAKASTMADGSGAQRSAPLLWLLASPHEGDNTQLFALARALGWPFEVKRLRFRRTEPLLRFIKSATLAAVDITISDRLEPPWPDAILLSGRANEAAAFWIKRHGNPRCKIIFIGTPHWPLEAYDLIITTPQYRLPERANILHLDLPIHAIGAGQLAGAATQWAQRLSALPTPLTALLVGGSSGPYVFDQEGALRLARQASAHARAHGGSLLVTTSARTPPIVSEILEKEIDAPRHFHRWRRGDPDNPFLAFLALADEIIVTADSVSMIAEACATAKPVHLFDFEDGGRAMRAEEASPGRMPQWRGRNAEATAFRLLMRHAPPRLSRDIRIVHRAVIGSGQAAWLGETLRPRGPEIPANSLERSRLRLSQLFGL